MSFRFTDAVSTSAAHSSHPRSTFPKQKVLQSSSGQTPLSHPGLAEHACHRREPIKRIDTYHCAGAVNVPDLLRTTRFELLDFASMLGANALVEEQWTCTILGSRSRNKRAYKAQIRYEAQATRSTWPDPHWPVALNQARSIPGLMTVLRRTGKGQESTLTAENSEGRGFSQYAFTDAGDLVLTFFTKVCND
ncbi:hypothetical protein AX14_013531 [Amanita brunnescens Koide BX004]|nr:hypothetical protein AX14_013531 [Amanita brunnescens Koide BX004]